MSDKPAKRFWFRYTGGIEYVESAPAAAFDAWAESTLFREGLVASSDRFGDPELRAKPQPMVRYERCCGNAVTDWFHMMDEHADVKRRRIAYDAVIPAAYPLSAFIATRFSNIWDVIPVLVRRFASLTKPASIIIDCMTVPSGAIEPLMHQLHPMLVKLVGNTKHTSCYGPIVCARYGEEIENDEHSDTASSASQFT
jgi:hypothetical protein